jgi:NADH dehydrogenase
LPHFFIFGRSSYCLNSLLVKGWAVMSGEHKYLVIVGGGFAGVYTARNLQKRLPPRWEIILFSQENHFIFTPLLGDVVGSSINPMHVVWPVRQMVRHATCRTAPLTSVDLARQVVEYLTPKGERAVQPFDQLVLACGSALNLDIIPGMAAHGWPLKTMGDALMLRNHLIGQLERAEVETTAEARRRLLSMAVVGAGFSGVEVAGEIPDLLRASCRFYRNVQASDIRVTLLEGRERILPELPEKLSAFAHGKMTKNGVTIRTRAVVRAATETGLHLADGSHIEAGTIVCTIGTTANPLCASLGLPMQYNRLQTAPDMRVQGHDNVWAIGDCAAVPNAYHGKPAAPTAQVAVRQAKQLADNILRALDRQPTRPFFYKPLGMLASIGNYKAVGLVFGLRLSGFPAWFLWRGVYLAKMPTLARKIQIAFDWAWQLFFPRDIVELNIGQTDRLGRAHFEAGEYVFHKGDPGDVFYVIEKGRAGVYLDEAAPPVVVLRPGEHFGEGALLKSAPRSATVKAEDSLDVLLVNKDSFGQLASHLEVLRQAMERSLQRNESVAELFELSRDHPLLNNVRVAEVMKQPVATLPVSLKLGAALARAQKMGKGAYPVVDEAGRMLGIITRTHFYKALQRWSAADTPLADVMTQPVVTVRASATLTDALVHFLRAPIKRLVVVEDEAPSRPVGMLTPFDIIQVLGKGDMALLRS